MHHKRLITTRKLANTKQKITMRSSNRTGRTAIAARLAWDAGGQALIETALFSMVLVLMLALAVNFAYVVYIDAGITSAGRQAATYAAQGQQAAAGSALPAVSAACQIAANEVNGWAGLSSANWGAYAASSALGGSSWANTSSCAGNSNSTAPAYNADPESATFTVNAVKVSATPSPLVNFSILGKKASTILPSATYGRTVYMRQLN
jgi:Flp pilus assembly protein TadG